MYCVFRPPSRRAANKQRHQFRMITRVEKFMHTTNNKQVCRTTLATLFSSPQVGYVFLLINAKVASTFFFADI